jgi:hypothetical protein
MLIQTLPFQKIAEIKQALKHVDIQDLVLVLSQAKDDKLILAYNTDQPPEVKYANWQVERLLDLTPSLDFATYNGLIVGFPAIDIILPDVPTHGVNFYSIEHVFRQQGKTEQLRQTSYRLAATLLDYLEHTPYLRQEELKERVHAKAIQLALPSLLDRQPVENLVAVLPSTNLRDFLRQDNTSWQLIYNSPSQANDLSWLERYSLDKNTQWLVALEEIELFCSGLGREYPLFIDLRQILRGTEAENGLNETCRGLARRCWQMWSSSHDNRFLTAAYSLAAEARLAEENVNNLVALLPSNDFESFVAEGAAIRVYRFIEKSNTTTTRQPGLHYSIDQLDTSQVKEEFAAPLLAFPVLTSFITHGQGREVVDLGPVFWKAGRAMELARTYWLLSRDMLQLRGPVWRSISATPEEITNLAVRAALIYSLYDPWQWRQSRYPLFLRECYTHVMQCLDGQKALAGSNAVANYFVALREWYGCYETGDQVGNLSAMTQALRTFLEGSQALSNFRIEREIANDLFSLGGELTLSEQETGPRSQEYLERRPRPFEVTNYLRNVADTRVPIRLPSHPFKQQLFRYYQVHAQWRTVQDKVKLERPSFEVLDGLLGEYSRFRRVTFAPAHEMAMLQRMYEDDMARVRRLKQAIEIGPIIKIKLRNPWITLIDRSQKLTIELENIGGMVAHQFKLELTLARGFDLVSRLEPLPPEELFPGTLHRLECEIRAKESGLILYFNYTFQDQQGRIHSHPEEIQPAVHQSHSMKIKPINNPYEVGRPVFGEKFFGRRNELEKILASLAKGSTQPTLLHGPRRLGKTSLMREIEVLLKDRQELRKMGLAPDLESQLSTIHPVFLSLQSLTQSLSQPNYVALFLQDVIERISRELGFEVDTQLLEREFNRYPTRAFTAQIDRIFEQYPTQRVLVLVDEWDEVYQQGLSELGKNLRYLLQHEQRISWIFSSTWILIEEAKLFSSPFFNQLYQIPVANMNWESATTLVTAPSNDVGVEWEGDAVVAVVEHAGQRPSLIQLLCSRAIGYLIDNPGNVVDNNVVSVVINQLVKEADTTAHFGFLWSDREEKYNKDDNKVHWMGRLILWILDRHYPEGLARQQIRDTIIEGLQHYLHELSNGAEVFSEGPFNREFDDQINKLHMVFDAITVDERKRYSLSIPLLRRWLHQVLSLQDETALTRQAYAGLLRDLQGG